MMFVWLQLPASAVGGWSLETVIDMEKKLRFLDPHITGDPGKRIEFEGSGKTTGEEGIFLFISVLQSSLDEDFDKCISDFTGSSIEYFSFTRYIF
jgi:hypothetical protein